MNRSVGPSEEYYRQHKCCPVCGSSSFESTCLGFLGDRDFNEANCDCGWKGTIDDRVDPDHKPTIENKAE